MSGPQKPSWTEKGGDWRAPNRATPKPGAAAPGTSKGKPQAAWAAAPTSSGGGPTRRTFWRWGLSAILLGLIATLVAWLLLPRPTPLVTVLATRYASPLAPNAWGAEDVEAFKSQWVAVGKRSPAVRLHTLAAEGSARAEFLNDLVRQLKNEGVAAGGPDALWGRSKVLLLYLSMHGLVDSDGDAALLLPTPESRSERPYSPQRQDLATIKLVEIFQHLNEHYPAWRGARKVVFLDCHRCVDQWRAGVLHNDFATMLAKTLAAVDDERLILIASNAAGQMSWADPQLQGTVFAHFFRRGLAGEADRDDDGRVNLQELFAWLLERVDQHVQSRFGDRQTPQIFAAEKFMADRPADKPSSLPKVLRFALAWAEKPSGAASAPANSDSKSAAPRSAGDSAVLESCWSAHDRLRPWREQGEPAGTLQRKQLLNFLAFEQVLLRYEQLLDAGPHYLGEASATLGQVRAIQAALERSAAAPVFADSLALQSLWLDRELANDADDRLGKAVLPIMAADVEAAKTSAAPDTSAKASESSDASGGQNADKSNPTGQGSAKPTDPAAKEPIPAKKSSSDKNSGDKTSAGKTSESKDPGEPKVSDNEASPPTEAKNPASELLPTDPEQLKLRWSDVPYARRVATAWRALLAEASPGSQEEPSIALWLKMVGEPEDREQTEFVEHRWLKLLGPEGRLPAAARGPNGLIALALQARQAAERAAACHGDERVCDAVRQLVEQGDEARRQAEDLLFVGQPQDCRAARDLWEKANQSYGDAATRAAELAQAYALRDRLWSELPHYTAYFGRQRAVGAKTTGDEQASGATADLDRCALLAALASNISRKLDLLSKLARDKDADPDTTAKTRSELTDLREDAHANLAALQTKIEASGDQIHSLDVRQSLDYLATPLVSGNRRMLLRTRVLGRLRGGQQSIVGSSAVADSRSAVEMYAARRRINPLLLLATLAVRPVESAVENPDDGSTKESSPLTVAAAAARISGEGARFRAALSEAYRALAGDEAKGPRPYSGLEAAGAGEHLLRASASSFTLDARPGMAEREMSDPVGRLWRADAVRFFGWRLSRACRDFWGPLPVRASVADDYFRVAAKNYLRQMEVWTMELGTRLASRVEPLNETQLAELQVDAAHAEYKRRSAAADSFLALRAEAVWKQHVGPESSGDKQSKTPLQTVEAADVPEGIAALFVDSLAGLAPDCRLDDEGMLAARSRLPLGNSKELAARHELYFGDQNAGANDSSAANWQIAAYYRGRLTNAPLQVADDAGRTVEWKTGPTQPPRISVSGDYDGRLAITFVLDCSASMQEPLAGGEGGLTRMVLAKAALKSILSDLAHREGVRAALWLYGNKGKAAGPGRAPDYDVNKMIALSSLNESTLEQFLAVVDGAQPTGRTPLYLAMRNTVADLAAERTDANSLRRVVVITDGVDEVLDPEADYPNLRQVGELLQKQVRDKRDVALDLVFIHGGQQQQWQIERRDDLERWAKANVKGADGPLVGYHGVNKKRQKGTAGENELQDTLERTLQERRPKFTVSPRVDGQTREPLGTPRMIGEVWELPSDFPLDESSGDFRLAVQALGQEAFEDIKLEGGEALQMQMRYQGAATPRLLHPPYARTAADKRTCQLMLGKAEGIAADVVAHTAVRTGSSLRFPVSLHCGGGRFTPRPAEMWFEVLPLDRAGKPLGDQPYVCYDRSFENDQPLPVLECTALGWPRAAESARLCLWFKMTATPRSIEKSVVQAAAASQPSPDLDLKLGTKSAEGADGKLVQNVVRFNVRVSESTQAGESGVVVEVEELHPSEATAGQVKVDLSAAAGRAVRTFSNKARRVVHQFAFPGRRKEFLSASDVRLYIWRADDVKRDALSFDTAKDATGPAFELRIPR